MIAPETIGMPIIASTAFMSSLALSNQSWTVNLGPLIEHFAFLFHDVGQHPYYLFCSLKFLRSIDDDIEHPIVFPERFRHSLRPPSRSKLGFHFNEQINIAMRPRLSCGMTAEQDHTFGMELVHNTIHHCFHES